MRCCEMLGEVGRPNGPPLVAFVLENTRAFRALLALLSELASERVGAVLEEEIAPGQLPNGDRDASASYLACVYRQEKKAGGGGGAACRRASLTPRQKEVLGCAAQGLTSVQIGRRLGIRPNTVNTHLKTIYRKLNVESRAGAVSAAVLAGAVRIGM